MALSSLLAVEDVIQLIEHFAPAFFGLLARHSRLDQELNCVNHSGLLRIGGNAGKTSNAGLRFLNGVLAQTP